MPDADMILYGQLQKYVVHKLQQCACEYGEWLTAYIPHRFTPDTLYLYASNRFLLARAYVYALVALQVKPREEIIIKTLLLDIQESNSNLVRRNK